MTAGHGLLVVVLLAVNAILLWGILQATSSILSLLQDQVLDGRSILRRRRILGSSTGG
jgi:hypothetical protein